VKSFKRPTKYFANSNKSKSHKPIAILLQIYPYQNTLFRVLQVKQCGTKINKIYNVTLPRENIIQENQKYTKRTPRDPRKLHFVTPRKVTNWHQKSQEKMGENDRECGEILA
jgi:hypothetical protein